MSNFLNKKSVLVGVGFVSGYLIAQRWDVKIDFAAKKKNG